MDKSNKIGHKEGVKEVKHIDGAIIQSHASYMHFQHAWIWKEEEEEFIDIKMKLTESDHSLI